jgi:hypothetical protein
MLVICVMKDRDRTQTAFELSTESIVVKVQRRGESKRNRGDRETMPQRLAIRPLLVCSPSFCMQEQ